MTRHVGGALQGTKGFLRGPEEDDGDTRRERVAVLDDKGQRIAPDHQHDIGPPFRVPLAQEVGHQSFVARLREAGEIEVFGIELDLVR